MNLYDVMDKCPDDWFDVFIKTANVIVETYKNKVSVYVYFHRLNLCRKSMRISKKIVMNYDKRLIKMKEDSFSNDKFVSCDIWMST